MRPLILLYFLLVIFIDSNAQESTHRQYVKAGDLFFDEYKDYYNAGEFYKSAFNFNKKDSTWLSFRIAESSFESWKLRDAEEYFLNVITNVGDSCILEYDSSRLKLGLVYQRMSNYPKAIEAFNSFVDYSRKCNPENESDRAYANQLINTIEWSRKQAINPDITIDSLGNINDTRKHELAPVPIGDSLIYTSLYFPEERFQDFEHQVGNIFLNHNDSITNVFLNDLRKGKRDSTVAFMTFNEDMSRMYYSVCHNINTTKRKCRIVARDRNSNFEKTLLGEIGDSSTYIHPHWTRIADGGIEEELLYFVSDRQGGNGGLDIWYVGLFQDSLGIKTPVVNLQSINTSADEVSPFFDTKSQTLYFSSDRIIDSLSFGGRDIYKAALISGLEKYGATEILELPYNSSKNDMFYVRSGNKSWLSSNRRAPKNENPLEDGCCYDIFEAIDTSIPDDYLPGQDTIYYKPEFSICPVDTMINSSVSELYPITGSSSEEQIAHDSDRGFQVFKELKYKLVLQLRDKNIDTSFHISYDSVDKGFVPQIIDITKPVFHRPIIRDYCTSKPIDVFDPDLELKLIQYDSISKKAIETISINSDGVFPVRPGMNYWLVIDKEGYQIDTFEVYCTKDCEISSCEYFIQQEKVKLTLMTKYICGSINTFLSTNEYSEQLSSPTNTIRSKIDPVEILQSSRVYSVNPWEKYNRTVSFPNGIDTTTTIYIKTIRNQCDTTHVMEYIDHPR